MSYSPTEHASSEASTPGMSETVSPPTLTLDVVACDGADSAPIVVAAHSLGAEVRLSGSPEAWFEKAGRPGVEEPETPDVVAFLAGSDRMVSQRWIARAVASSADSRVLAVLSDAVPEHTMSVVNQGTHGLILLPLSSDRVTHHLREVLEPAARGQTSRLAAARHRRDMATLTTAELDVLTGMLDGMANKQIAQRLSIGLRTVELRRSKIMRKMNATGLAQLISFVCTARQGVA
ncbi:response regulator FixJ [Planctomycetes bacterium MalM25]|nr:response regulator FixJ [Planctomycetes bacterium MalM25]